MTTEEWFDKAIAYFNGTMSVEQSQLLEEQTAANEELSELMRVWKRLNIEAPIYEKFRNEASDFIRTHERLKAVFVDKVVIIPPAKKTRIWKWVAVAATVAGIIIIIKFLAPSSHPRPQVVEQIDTPRNTAPPGDLIPNREGEKLFAQNFSPDRIPEDPNGALDDAFFYYESKQYKKAVAAIDSYQTKALTRGAGAEAKLTAFYAVYYKALSLLALDNVADALPLLNEALKVAPSTSFKTKAQWYLVLGYLKRENLKSARETLELIINSHSADYQSRATHLLAELTK